jgi:hypothetical protein
MSCADRNIIRRSAARAAADRDLVEAERGQRAQAFDAAVGRADDGEGVDEIVGQGAGLSGIASCEAIVDKVDAMWSALVLPGSGKKIWR